MFPISRDPPEGGTIDLQTLRNDVARFPISRDPPEGGTFATLLQLWGSNSSFQFLGIPPKGEQGGVYMDRNAYRSFQFLGIPPKGEHSQRCYNYGAAIQVSNF